MCAVLALGGSQIGFWTHTVAEVRPFFFFYKIFRDRAASRRHAQPRRHLPLAPLSILSAHNPKIKEYQSNLLTCP